MEHAKLPHGFVLNLGLRLLLNNLVNFPSKCILFDAIKSLQSFNFHIIFQRNMFFYFWLKFFFKFLDLWFLILIIDFVSSYLHLILLHSDFDSLNGRSRTNITELNYIILLHFFFNRCFLSLLDFFVLNWCIHVLLDCLKVFLGLYHFLLFFLF